MASGMCIVSFCSHHLLPLQAKYMENLHLCFCSKNIWHSISGGVGMAFALGHFINYKLMKNQLLPHEAVAVINTVQYDTTLLIHKGN